MATFSILGANAKTVLDAIYAVNSGGMGQPLDLNVCRWDLSGMDHQFIDSAALSQSTTGAPTASNDEAEGYSYGSKWTDETPNPDQNYICLDATETSAVWATYDLPFDVDLTGTVTTVTHKFIVKTNDTTARPVDQATLDAMTKEVVVTYDSTVGDIGVVQSDTISAITQLGGVSLTSLSNTDARTFCSMAALVFAKQAKELLQEATGQYTAFTIGSNL